MTDRIGSEWNHYMALAQCPRAAFHRLTSMISINAHFGMPILLSTASLHGFSASPLLPLLPLLLLVYGLRPSGQHGAARVPSTKVLPARKTWSRAINLGLSGMRTPTKAESRNVGIIYIFFDSYCSLSFNHKF